jgi:hypothetical protein
MAGSPGTALQMQQPVMWPAASYVALLGVAACGLVLARFAVVARTRLPAAALTAAFFAVTGPRAGARQAGYLPAALEDRDNVVVGVVGLPRHSEDGVRFTFDVDGATYEGRPVVLPPRISLGWNEDALVNAGASRCA